jgi:cytochrome c553
MTRWELIPLAAMAWLALMPSALLSAQSSADESAPEWAIPREGPPRSDSPAADQPYSLPGSDLVLSQEQIDNPFDTPDWFPSEHEPMPRIVKHGDESGTWACAMCHLASGTGHPQSARLAGLSADYIARQLAAFKSDDRTSYLGDFIDKLHSVEDEADGRRAAEWFASLPQRSGVKVIESSTVPKTAFYGTSFMRVIASDATGQREPIAGRIIEVPENYAEAKARSPRSRFIAYVPEGSIEKGRKIATQGVAGVAPCVTCHGTAFDGTGLGPALAGAFPSYIVRQLYDFRHGKRAGLADQTGYMSTSSRLLSPEDIVNVASYLGSLDSNPG